MAIIKQALYDEPKIDGDTPAMRLFALLEVIARKDQFFSLQGLVEELGLPKPTLHRMLQQLEAAGIIQRDGDGRQYSRSEEHTSELQSLMRISYAVFCLKKKNTRST